MLRPIKTDDWLMHLEEYESKQFPLTEILKDSLFYPASGVDSDPVRLLRSYTTSFVYCDYGHTADEVSDWLRYAWCQGYEDIRPRQPSLDELAPEVFRMPPLDDTDPDPHRFATHRKEQFVTWFVFQRSTFSNAADGPRRFSVLFLGADGIAAFNTLYVTRRLAPAAIAIIQPGHHFGGANYDNFENQDGVLGRLVLKNPAGAPDILMFGGNQDESHYSEACWKRYRSLIARPERTSQPGHLGIWTRRHLKSVASNELFQPVGTQLR